MNNRELTEKEIKEIKERMKKAQQNLLKMLDDGLNPNTGKPLTEEESKQFMNYKKRLEDRKKEDAKLKQIKKAEISKEDLLEAEKKNKQTEQLGIMNKWINIVKSRSFQNIIPGKITLHSLVGQTLRNLFFYKNDGVKFSLKINLFWIQDSSTGKGRLFDILTDLIDLIGELDAGEFKGEESDGVLLDRFEMTKSGTVKHVSTDGGPPEKVRIVGKLSRFDFYIYREAECLINPHSNHNKAAGTYYLDILDEKSIPKELVSWGRGGTETVGTGSLLATTRISENTDKFVARSGLLQRCLSYAHEVPVKQRKVVNQEVDLFEVPKTISGEKRNEKYKKDLREIKKDLIEIKKWAVKNEKNIRPSNAIELNSLINKEFDDLYDKMSNNLKERLHIEIGGAFIARWKEMTLKLSYQNAIMRQSNLIETQDVLNALKLIKACYNSIETWLQENIIVNDKKSNRKEHYFNYINKMLEDSAKKKIHVSVKYIIKKLMQRFNIGESSGRNIINRLSNEDSFFKKYTRKEGTVGRNPEYLKIRK